MSIIKSQYDFLHPWTETFLREQKSQNPDYSVIDVGGVAMPWANQFVTDYLDIQSHAQIAGDACLQETWDKLNGRVYDFSICTNTLEDLRDPGFVISRLQKHSRAGFISVPHKHTELGFIEGASYTHIGYCHHRWVFALQSGKLRMLAKWPVAVQLTPGETHGSGYLTWLNRNLIKQGELGFIWETDFPYEYVRGDFPGLAHEGCEGMLAMYRDELADGL